MKPASLPGRLALALCAVASASALAQGVPATIPFSGNLTNSGLPVNGNVSMVFELFDGPDGGTRTWTEVQAVVPVKNGLVFADLGSATPFATPATIFNGAPLYLQVTVNGSVLDPRLAVASVPYAIRAGVANNLGPLAPTDVVAVTGNQTVAGTKTFSSPIVGSITGNAATATTATSATTAAGFSGALAGDVTGNQSTTRVTKLQSVAVSAAAPANNNVLTYVSATAQWQPQAVPAVTSLATGLGVTGGPITSTGTVALDVDPTNFGFSGNKLIIGTLPTTDNGYIRNQSAASQTASFNISGGGQVAGTMRAAAFAYTAPQTGYYSLGGRAFLVDPTVTTWRWMSTGLNYGYISAAGCTDAARCGATLMAPVHLPNGATITLLECSVWDQSPSGNAIVSARLFRNTTYYTAVLVGAFLSQVTTGTTVATGPATFSAALSHVVDTSSSYDLIVDFATGDGSNSVVFTGCRITYTSTAVGN
jgi:hypothetical protein